MIFIPGNVPSMKNSRIYSAGKGSFHSKACQHYLRDMGIKHFSSSKREVIGYKTRQNLFRESVGNYFDECIFPLQLGIHFVRHSRRRFDFVNMCQIVLDLLVAHRCLPDDSMDYVWPYVLEINGRGYSVDRTKPGVFLKRG